MLISVHHETAADVPDIHRINASAFESEAEANLVAALRQNDALTLSLVARVDGQVVGHIAFSEVLVRDPAGAEQIGIGLGPMAVDEHWRGQGVGGQLIAAGLEQLRSQGHPFCVVLGQPDFYRNHGFKTSAPLGIRWEHKVPDEVFMVQALRTDGLRGIKGLVSYRPEFGGV